MPSISVITPCFNAGPLIGQLADSLAAQTMTDFEWIVVDDGSREETLDVLNAIERRSDLNVRIDRQQHQGGSACRNLGFDRSTSPYVKFVDADDLLDARLLELQWRASEQNPGAMIVSPTTRMGSDGSRFRSAIHANMLSDPLAAFLKRMWFMHGGALIPRSMVQQIGGWNADLLAAQDLDFFRRLLLIASPKVVLEDRTTFIYRDHDATPRVSRPSDPCAKFKTQLLALDQFRELVEQHGKMEEYRSVLATSYDRWAGGASVWCPAMTEVLLRRARETCADYPKNGGRVYRTLRAIFGLRLSSRLVRSPAAQRISYWIGRWRGTEQHSADSNSQGSRFE